MSTNQSFWPVVVRWGIIGGLIQVAYSTLSNMLGLSNPGGGGNWGMAIVAFLISAGISVFISWQAIVAQRTLQENYITLGRGFAVAFWTLMFASVIGLIYGYIYMTLIDPGIMEAAMESSRAQLEQRGYSDEQIEEGMAMTSRFLSPAAITVMGLVGSVFFNAIYAIIMAAILKNDPPAETTVLDSEQ